MTNRATENKIVLVVRKTRFEDLLYRFNTEGQAQFYIEHLGADFGDYKQEHTRYRQSVQEVQSQLATLGRVQTVDREYVPSFQFGPNDTVVVLGQDGLVANVLKYLDRQVVIGINPDPGRWEGVLLPFKVWDAARIAAEVFAGQRKCKEITMAQATLNTQQTLLAVNDFFIGRKTHVSARYQIEAGGRKENHSSSGVIVSTGLGSTGWLRSILAGATGIAQSISGQTLSISKLPKLTWDCRFLVFSVREPWASKTTGAEITFGKITAKSPLRLLSQMSENGVIFSDGIEQDYLEFNSGAQAVIGVAEKRGRLVV
jgi:NAD kinase